MLGILAPALAMMPTTFSCMTPTLSWPTRFAVPAMHASMDPYDALGIARDAGNDEIKAAFRANAFKWHPDRHADDEKARAEHNFKEIALAYETLLSSAADDRPPPQRQNMPINSASGVGSRPTHPPAALSLAPTRSHSASHARARSPRSARSLPDAHRSHTSVLHHSLPSSTVSLSLSCPTSLVYRSGGAALR